MNRNILLLLLVLILGGIAFGLYTTKGDGKNTMTKSEDRIFGVKDVSTIGKIRIDQKKYPSLYFVRSGSSWKMNNQKNVNQYVLNDFLGLISKVDINYIPTKAMTSVIHKDMEKNGVRFRIWDTDEKLIRDFIVGSELGNATGTPFLVSGASQPYVMRVPGFVGSIRTRMINRINEWESKDIYTFNPDNIESVEVIYHRDDAASFTVSKDNDKFMIGKPGLSEPQKEGNQKTGEAYFTTFSSIIAEYNDSENPERENIKSHQKFATVTVNLQDGSKSIIDYISYADISVNYETKSPHQIHPDNKFFAETNDNEMYLVQQRVIWPVFRTYDYFF